MNATAPAFQSYVDSSAFSASTPVPDQRDTPLADALRQIKALPVDQRMQAIVGALGAFIDQKAASNASPVAMAFASGFRTMERSMRHSRSITPELIQPLGTFLGWWLLALMEEGIAMNPPEHSVEGTGDVQELTLAWRRGDRTLDVVIASRGSVKYSATSFTVDRHLDYQDGDLDLSLPAMRRTVRWLAGIESA